MVKHFSFVDFLLYVLNVSITFYDKEILRSHRLTKLSL